MAEERDSPSLTTLEGLNGRSFSTVSVSATRDMNALGVSFEDRMFLRDSLLSFLGFLLENQRLRGKACFIIPAEVKYTACYFTRSVYH
jgi:hypothetical protein